MLCHAPWVLLAEDSIHKLYMQNTSNVRIIFCQSTAWLVKNFSSTYCRSFTGFVLQTSLLLGVPVSIYNSKEHLCQNRAVLADWRVIVSYRSFKLWNQVQACRITGPLNLLHYETLISYQPVTKFYLWISLLMKQQSMISSKWL